MHVVEKHVVEAVTSYKAERTLAKYLKIEWATFWPRLHCHSDFQNARAGLSVSRLEDVCRVCWVVCMKDGEALQTRMREMNVHYLKQLQFLKEQAQIFQNVDPTTRITEKHLIDFYEPLQYVDGVTRQLIIEVLADKVDAIIKENLCPSSLVRDLAEAGAGTGGRLKAELKEAEERVHDLEFKSFRLEGELSEVKESLEDKTKESERRGKQIQAGLIREAKLSEQLAASVEEVKAGERKCEALTQQIVALTEEKTKLLEKNAELVEKNADLEVELEYWEAEKKKTDAELQSVKGDLQDLKNKGDDARHQQEEMAQALERASKIEDMLQKSNTELKQKLASADELIDELRAQLKKQDANADDYSDSFLQTDLTTGGIANLEKTNQNLKASVTGLVANMCLKFKTKDVENCLEAHSLCDVVSLPSIYERLHEDAMRRLRLQESDCRRAESCKTHLYETNGQPKTVRKLAQTPPLKLPQMPPAFVPAIDDDQAFLPPLINMEIPSKCYPWHWAGYLQPGETTRRRSPSPTRRDLSPRPIAKVSTTTGVLPLPQVMPPRVSVPPARCPRERGRTTKPSPQSTPTVAKIADGQHVLRRCVPEPASPFEAECFISQRALEPCPPLYQRLGCFGHVLA